MTRTTLPLAACVAAFAIIAAAVPASASPPRSFESSGTDRAAIEALLRTYTIAVSSKDEALYETLLLNRDIPRSGETCMRAAPIGIRYCFEIIVTRCSICPISPSTLFTSVSSYFHHRRSSKSTPSRHRALAAFAPTKSSVSGP